MSCPVVLQWRESANTGWNTVECSSIPVSGPAKIRIDFSTAGALLGLTSLVEKIEDLVKRVHGSVGPASAPGPLIEPDDGDNLLEVVVSDGQTPFALDPRIAKALKPDSRAWALPLMPKSGSRGVMPADLQKQNIAFWTTSIDELALTVLARAGVTSLDRRVFISYRRVDTQPVAEQLFDALTERNFRVFLDTVSVDPGVNFQASLFEQLADKSMVVMLHSETFATSKWTMEEFHYTKGHDLSLLILRFPTVKPGDELEKHYRAGDVLQIRDTDLSPVSQGAPQRLTDQALAHILTQIMEVHDLEMIKRVAQLRKQTLEALQANQVSHQESTQGASIFAQSTNNGKSYRLFPTSRPPGLPELYDASTFTREQGDHRIVVGHISSFNDERRRQLDWTVLGRNVVYTDVTMLDSIVQQIKGGQL